MLVKLLRKLNPFSEDVNRIERRKQLMDEESEIFKEKQYLDSEMLDTQYKREDVKWDVNHRQSHLNTLQVQIRSHWENYKEWLKSAREDNGIDELKAKTKAKQAKKAAKDKQQLYKLLWLELDALKDGLRQDEQIRILSGGNYRVDFSDIDGASAEQAAQQRSSKLRKRRMMVEQFKHNTANSMEDIELDFSDIEKDVAELEMEGMEDVDIFVEGQPKQPEIEAETEWD